MNLYLEIIKVVLLSLFVSITATLLATIAGFAIGIPFALKEFRYMKSIKRFTGTLMSIPPVLMGLFLYIILSEKGVLGFLEILFTPFAMIIAQFLLIFPIIFGLTLSAVEKSGREIKRNSLAIGINKKEIFFLIIKECRVELISVVAAGFGRGISEVGAVMMVGGNIKGETRVMTTYIALETGKGNFNGAIIIGLILLFISFIINYILHKFSSI